MIEQLFGSKTRVKLLQLFYSNPNRSFYVREITRKIDEQINSVRRELANLLSIGIISSDNNNNRLYYEVNQQYEYYPALAAIFGKGGSKMLAAVGKEVTPATDDDTSALKKVGNIELALLTGQFTRDESAGIDMLIVGDVNQAKMNKYVSEMEAKEGKEIRFAVMDGREYEYRHQVNDRFLHKVIDAKKQILIDKRNRFTS
jgi:predicted transcriptional regulator